MLLVNKAVFSIWRVVLLRGRREEFHGGPNIFDGSRALYGLYGMYSELSLPDTGVQCVC